MSARGWFSVAVHVVRGRFPVGRLQRRHRKAEAAFLVVVLLAALGRADVPDAAGAPCNLVPQFRDVTINQGLGSYTKLVQGKETLVRAYLSLPSCAGSTSTISLVGGALTVSGGGITNTTQAPFPVPGSPLPLISPYYRTTPPVDSLGDPKFIVPGSFLDPGASKPAYTATFTIRVDYRAVSGSTTTNGSVTFTKMPGSTSAITKAVERDTNPLRILVVPMGDARQSYASQYSAAAHEQLQLAMQTLSRVYPVPDGTGDLTSTTGGVRYTVLPTLLDVSTVLDTDGLFCLRGSNFDSPIKGQLTTFAQEWETANRAANGGAGIQIDVVIGVIDAAISKETNCGQGIASGSSAYTAAAGMAVVRLSPGLAGGVMAMEVSHALGLVPSGRGRTGDSAHSPVTEADAGTNRGYNLRDRTFLANDRTTLYQSSGFNNTSVLMEQLDYAFLLCALGGSTTTDCGSPGVIGDNLAGPRFVLTGTVAPDGLSATVVESYSSEVPATPAGTAGPFVLRQIDNQLRLLRQDFVPVAFGGTNHGDGPHLAGVVDVAVPFNPDADVIEFRNTAGAGTLLDSWKATDPPVITESQVVDAGETNYTDDATVDDQDGTVSPDGAWVAWTTVPDGDLSRIHVGPIGDSADAVEFNAFGTTGMDAEGQSQPAWSPDGTQLAFVSDGDLWTVPVDTSGGSPSFGTPYKVSDADSSDLYAGHPTWSPDGSEIAFDAIGAIFVIPANGTTGDETQLTFTGDASHPSWSQTAGDDRIAYQRDAPTGILLLASVGRRSSARPVAPASHTGPHIVVTRIDDPAPDGCAVNGCTLREAMLEANASVGTVESIDFSVGSGEITIQPTSALPTISDPVIIDGFSQPGVWVNTEPPHVEIDGTLAGASVNGLTVTAGSSVIQGLVINRFTRAGIRLETAGGNIIQGNYIGTDLAGTADRGNVSLGIEVFESANNTIGGTGLVAGQLNATQGNVISGNGGGIFVGQGIEATGNQILGNYIGTDTSGGAALGNDGNGVAISAPSTIVGGSAAGARNVISGNGTGVRIGLNTGSASNNNIVQGNYIGTDVGGTIDLGNATSGVSVTGTGFTGNVIGGSGAGEGNLISGNNQIGVDIQQVTNTRVEGNLIGTDVTGTLDLGNTLDGVRIISASSNSIGAASAGGRNIISGNNSAGVDIVLASGNSVEGNYIGTDITGELAVPNLTGVTINSATGNTVGGYSAAERNVISGNSTANVFISGGTATGNVVVGNYIGPDKDGTTAVGTSGAGIRNRSPNNFFGDDVAGAGNVISGNSGSGIEFAGDGTGSPTDNVVQRNLIGVAADGTTPLPNTGNGIGMSHGNNDIGGIGDGNVIANNGGNGVLVNSLGAGNTISDNSIYNNTELGIDLVPLGVTGNDAGDGDTGANDLQNFPVLTSATSDGVQTTIVGSLSTSPGVATYGIQVFTNGTCDTSGNGEGETMVLAFNVVTDVDGNAPISVTTPDAIAGDVLTATATNPGGSTSEFSQCLTVTGSTDSPSWVVNVIDDAVNTGGCTLNHCSLREAIQRANLDPNGSEPDVISFDIPTGTDTPPHVIVLGSRLPDLIEGVVIDGTTEPDYPEGGPPVIELDGSGLDAADDHGFHVVGGDTTIRGLAIGGFGGAGIYLDGNTTASNDNFIERNYIGVGTDGTTDRGVGSDGLRVSSSNTNEYRQNVISGNGGNGIAIEVGDSGADEHLIVDNVIGLSADASARLPNVQNGILADGAIYTSIDSNVIAGNGAAGVELRATNLADLYGNHIGTNEDGDTGLGNAGHGVFLNDADFASIGQDTLNGGSYVANVIVGNGGDGVLVDGGLSNSILGNAIGVFPSGSGVLAGNTQDGIRVTADANGTDIGGSNVTYQLGNLVGGNGGSGISLENVDGTDVVGNAVGTGVLGVSDFGNTGAGIEIGPGVSTTTIGGTTDGEANFIAFNGGDGIEVASTSTRIAIRGNSIDQNDGLGIDLEGDGPTLNDELALDADSGANDRQNFPTLTVSEDGTQVFGVLRSAASQQYTIELFQSATCDSSNLGEGDQLHDTLTVTTNAAGYASFISEAGAIGPDDSVTGTATDINGNTSEFSVCAQPEVIGTQVWTLDPDSPAATQELLVADGGEPSWGTGGTIAFSRSGNIWTVRGDGTGESQRTSTEDDSMPSLGGTLAFTRFLDTGTQDDVFLLSDRVQITVTATFDPDSNEADRKMNLLYTCPGSPNFDVAVALAASQSDATSASWIANYDPSLACPNGTLRAVLVDGFRRTTATTGHPVANPDGPPVAAIYEPTNGDTLLQHGGLALHGSGNDSNDGELHGSALQWSVGGADVSASCNASHSHCDIQPPAGGWPLGPLTIRLEATDTKNSVGFDVATIDVLEDADNDGIPAPVDNRLPTTDVQDCGTNTGGDSNPRNAYFDADRDGYLNGSDYILQDACVAATSYPANTVFSPDTLYIPSAGASVTMMVTLPLRDIRTVIGNTVRLHAISGEVVDLPNTGWLVDKNGVGIAKFDRQALIRKLQELGRVGTSTYFTITGTSSQGWTFEGTDAADVKPAN